MMNTQHTITCTTILLYAVKRKKRNSVVNQQTQSTMLQSTNMSSQGGFFRISQR